MLEQVKGNFNLCHVQCRIMLRRALSLLLRQSPRFSTNAVQGPLIFILDAAFQHERNNPKCTRTSHESRHAVNEALQRQLYDRLHHKSAWQATKQPVSIYITRATT